ncbi:MAG: hypothetical protein WC292_07180, partial [Clostridia bacterium]
EAHPPLEVLIPARKVLNWKEKKHCAPIPPTPEIADEEYVMTLVPYGCTRIRVAQFPKLKI